MLVHDPEFPITTMPRTFPLSKDIPDIYPFRTFPLPIQSEVGHFPSPETPNQQLSGVRYIMCLCVCYMKLA